MASSAETYCLCGQPYNVGQFMIECDCCREWFHGSCVNVKVYQSEDIDKYHCPKCVPTYGPSIYRVPTNDHRQDRYELNADRKPLQAGSRAFVAGLSQRRFSQDKHVIVLHGHQFTELYLKDTGFNKPLQFENSAGLDLRVPPANAFSVRTVARHCGAGKEIDVIDVTRQTNFKMALGDFVDYFTSPPEERGDKVLNVLSLEFSDTPMCSVVWPPLMARQLDWVRVVWPPEASPQSPLVQRYCIMSPSGAYTDFHVDFGGTTVWYHVLHGQKVFYFIPPTATNLKLYQQWSSSPNQSEVFFGDLVESCTCCTLKRGQTLFIPTGWIHAVWTPEDSLVFGGNFLHSLNIELQLQVNEIEKQIDTPTIFRFPGFETIHWYAGAHLLQQLRRINEEQQDKDFIIGNEGIKDGLEVQKKSVLDLPPYLVRGVRILAAALKEWNACKSYDQSKKDNIPDTINSNQLVRELAKELRRLEKLLPQAQPAVQQSPLPKRKKKKPKLEAKPLKVSPQQDRHFASVSNSKHLPEPPMNYEHTNPRNLYNHHSTSLPPMPKKSLKLTLPKPIMHVPDSNHMFSNSSQDSEDAELNNMANLACRSGMASYSQGYDSQDSFGGENDFRGENDYRVPGESMEHDGRQKKNPYTELTSNERGGAVLKIKLGSPPSTSMEGSPRPPPNHGPPPDYATTEHSILKSHLIGNSSSNLLRQQQKPSNHWTISKSQVKNNINDSTDEQILFTNENLTMPGTSHSTVTSYVNAQIPYDGNGMLYGPGMYANDDIQATTQIVQQENNYDPEYVIDRKNNGMLPDYSPTKSINEYNKQVPVPFVEHIKLEDVKTQFHLASSFANNSDPYSQGMRAQDGASPFSGDDSTALTGADGYRLMQDDTKSGRMEVTEYVTENQVYDYVDLKGNLYKSDHLLDVKKESVVDRSGRILGQEHLQNNILVYDTVNSHVMEAALPPPAYNQNPPVTPRRTERPTRRRTDPRQSIYDYEDLDDSGALYIDEATPPPAPSAHKGRRKPKEAKGIKITIPAHVFRQEEKPVIPGNFSAPKNGIESLLQASVFTGSSDNQERDAVAGMLSIGQSYGLARAEPLPSRRSVPATEAPPIRAVHRDDEYVYPSLDMSSDEEDELNASSSRKTPFNRSHRKKTPHSALGLDRSDREDESWSPRGRLGRLLPRLNRPARRGSRREAVQAALRAARLRGVQQEETAQVPLAVVPPSPIASPPATAIPQLPPTPSHHLPVPHTPPTPHRAAGLAPMITSTPLREPAALTSLKKPYRKKRSIKPLRPVPVQHILPSPTTPKVVKFKKGMKTAKQRLGKILKIHKMMC